MTIFVMDYPTANGTCARDYIHVADLASAHVRKLNHLERGGDSSVFDCGYVRCFSLHDVVHMVKQVSGADFSVHQGGRWADDPPELITDSPKIQSLLGWKPAHDDLKVIVRSAFDWEKSWRA